MIIPAIDFAAGAVVQLIQGERLALRRDLDEVLDEFRDFPVLQIIDLDAAKNEGNNRKLVEKCCRAGHLVRVGGGIRTLERAREALESGAQQVILSSAIFQKETPNLAWLEQMQVLGREHLILGIDARQNQIAIHGWRTLLPITPEQAIAILEPYGDEFLYTHVDTEGLMQGIPLERIRELRARTARQLTVAGGIASMREIESLESMDCHCVLGMAIYTGQLDRQALLRHIHNFTSLPGAR